MDFFSCRFCCFSCRALACTRAIAPISLGESQSLAFLFQLLLLLMGTFLAFRARRDVWVLVLAALFIISEFGRFVRSEPSFGLTKLRAICVIVALTVTISLVGLRRQISEQQQGFSETFQWIQSHTY